ncbi:MAG: Fibronectin type protein (modular protein) [Arthrobacter sp.]|nr:Fibronectin type protein (modular protein) [Arthrobacter sp.]
MTLTWNPVGSQRHYRVWKSKYKDMSSATYYDRHEGNKTQIRGLANATTYYFRVRVITSGGASLSPYSRVFSTRTTASPFPSTPISNPLRVASWNIKCADYCNTGRPEERPWWQRRSSVVATIKRQMPDVLGVQEASQTWLKGNPTPGGLTQFEDLTRALRAGGTSYALTNTMRNNCVQDRYPSNCVYRNRGASKGTKILYNTSKVQLLRQGSKLLAGSTAADPRFLAWAVLKQKSTGKTFLFGNAHLTYASGAVNNQRRKTQTQSAVATLKAVNTSNLPVIMVGDLNSSKYTAGGNLPYDVLRAAGYIDPLGNTYKNSWPSAAATAEKKIRANYDSFNHLARTVRPRFNYGNGSYLDYIFTTKMRVGVWETVLNLDSSNRVIGIVPSDHNMIRASVQLP